MNILVRVLRNICVSVLAAFASLSLMLAMVLLWLPHMVSYGENTTFVSAWGLATGHGLYRLSELNNIPVFAAMYPPVFYLLLAAGIKLWGMTYIPGRVVVILAMLGCAGMIAGVSRRLGADILSAVMGALAFLGTYPAFVWCAYVRVDLIALFLELAAIFILIGRNAPTRRAIVFVLLAVMAGYTKQTAFGLVAGMLLAMILGNDVLQRKRAFLLGFAYAVTAILVFVVIDLLTGGGFHFFVLKVIITNLDWRGFELRFMELIRDPFTIVIMILGIVGGLWGKGVRWTIAFLLLPLAWAMRTSAFYGSDVNHYLESLAALSIGTALFINSIEKMPITCRNRVKSAMYVFLVLCVTCSVYSRKTMLKEVIQKITEFNSSKSQNKIEQFLKEDFPPSSLILTTFSDLPLLAGCVPVMSDPYLLTKMAEDGNWNPKPVVEALRDRRIKLVLMGEEVTIERQMRFLPKEVAEAVLANYYNIPGGVSGGIYLPKQLK